MVNINWQFQATIPGGPVIIINQPTVQVDGYDVALVTIAPGVTLDVPIQPSVKAANVVFLVISASPWDAKSALTYTVDGQATINVLDGPHLLVGPGAITLLNSKSPPQKLSFTNPSGTAVDVQVLVGRTIS